MLLRDSGSLVRLVPAVLAVSLSAWSACTSEVGDVGAAGGGAPTPTTGGEGGAGGAGAMGGAANEGGMGGASPECVTSADCATNPDAPVCEPVKQICVECTLEEDVCPRQQFCTTGNTCQVGCNDDTDCTAETICDVDDHLCVGCNGDADCADGSICINTQCVPGCSGIQPCEAGASCCSMTCYELDNDELHCGDCSTVCDPAPHSEALCQGGSCVLGPCIAPWENCNANAADGCEQNTLQDGPCNCVVNDTQPCYTGAPGTENIGLCKGGISTCVDGVNWSPCIGQVLPLKEQCNQLDDDCEGTIEPQPCEQCVPDTGTCMGNVGKWCKDDGLGYITEVCDPVVGTVCNPQTGKCDGDCGLYQLGSSYIGCEYWPTVTANLVNSAVFSFAVAVSNTTANTANVVVTKGPNTVITVDIAPNSVQIITLPWDSALKGPSSSGFTPIPASVRVNQGAHRLRSNQPVSVYQFNPLEYTKSNQFSYTNDASILLPVNVWTGKYRVASRAEWLTHSGFYAVTAKDDGTTVTVTPGPTSGTVKGGIPGIMSSGNGTVVLNAGDVIEVVTAPPDGNDVSGTLVTADKPVQVIGGHQCVNVPVNIPYCDHLEESMFPVQTLSTQYLVLAPLITANDPAKVEVIRILATDVNTSLSYEPPQPGAPASIAQAGGWVEINGNANDFQITADKPIMVIQYMEGQDAGGGTGDPAMTLAVATDQFRDDYLFHAPISYEINFINVVALTGTSVALDGMNIPPANWVAIGNTGYSSVKSQLSNAGNGNHTINGTGPFGISVYGYGQYTSYWYPGGSNLVKLHE